MIEEQNNPFIYKTPDSSSAKEIVDLYVPVFDEYSQIPSEGHTIIHGPRGSGKSMIFRYMSPDCITLDKDIDYMELDYLSFYIPIKEGMLDITELEFLKDSHGEVLLNEHFMITHITIRFFEQLSELGFSDNKDNVEEFKELYKSKIEDLMLIFGEENKYDLNSNNLKECIIEVSDIFNSIYNKFIYNYIYKIKTTNGFLPYNGPIFLFNDFLCKIIRYIKQLSFVPNSPVYLLIDDADNLSYIQTKILNNWISRRTTKNISIKISTQLKYKTYATTNKLRINTPHDYNEVNLSEKYTTSKGKYRSRIESIIKKRLDKYGYDMKLQKFFPYNEIQEKKIKKIFDEFTIKNGYDFAYRYATSEYLKSLAGNRYVYSYAGLDNIINISSGVFRIFIDIAYKMFETQKEINKEKPILSINHNVQNEVIKKYSSKQYEKFLVYEDEKLSKENIDIYEKLKNLVDYLGQAFYITLLSNHSERRVFAFYMEDHYKCNNELKLILKLGTQNGIFFKTWKSNKQGTGKMHLYILNRVLAPHFQLDPSSFAGYRGFTVEKLMLAMNNPKKAILNFRRQLLEEDSSKQLSIDDLL